VSWWHHTNTFFETKLIPDSLANESNLKKFDLPKALPSWLLVLIQENMGGRFSRYSSRSRYSRFSLKQAQTFSQEYASLSASGSPANLKEWQCQIIEKNALIKKVLQVTRFPQQSDSGLTWGKMLTLLHSTQNHSIPGHVYEKGRCHSSVYC